MEDFEATPDVLDLTADIIAAYVSNNKISAEALPDLIASTHAALSGLTHGAEPVEEVEDFTKSKAEIRKAVSEDGITSFLDGKKYKSLKRHITTNGMTVDEYRERFGLPDDFPMVAPSYSAARSALAKSMGLGVGGRKPKAPTPKPTRKPRAAKPAPAAEPAAE